MATRPSSTILLTAAAVAAALAGCGASGRSGGASTPAPAPAASSGAASPTTGATASAGAGALSADAHSAATGDIPDSQVFLSYSGAGFTMLYPEGWTQRTAHGQTTIQDKNNLVRVTLGKGAPPTPASVSAQLGVLQRAQPSLRFRPPAAITLPEGPAIKAVYTTESAPNPVTGKRVVLTVDRYELARGGRTAIVDLGTPVGVDNVDAYRRMIDSFRWR